MTLKVSWAQALAWRLERHLLEPIRDVSVADVVRRLCGVQAQVASAAELAVRVRQQASRPGEVDRALENGDVIKTWAMRGTLHLLTPDDAGSYLSLLAAGRSWEVPSWQKWFGVGPAEMEALRAAAREALDGAALTREELAAEVTKTRRLKHIGEALTSSWGSLLKPLAWQGDLCIGPSRGNRVTFMRPDQASRRWAGVPDVDEGAPRAILAYLDAYGPATVEGFSNFISRGRIGKRSLRAWFAAVHGQLTEVEVEGAPAYLPTDHVDALASATASKAVRLLPGFDQWVLGPGTDDPHVVAPARRSAVSRQAGWISPVVVKGGVVAGTWTQERDEIRVTWFAEAGRLARRQLQAEVGRLADVLARPLRLTVM